MSLQHICPNCGEWWGEDVVPRIRFRILVSRWRAHGWRALNESQDAIPDGYGVAYVLPWQDKAVIMPMPLNIIVGAFHRFVALLRYSPWVSHTARLAEAERRGRAIGVNEALHWLSHLDDGAVSRDMVARRLRELVQ